MYKLVILATVLAICSATVVLPTALHYVAAPVSSSKVTKVEWEHKPVSYVAAYAPVSYSSSKTVVHHAAPVVHHAAPIVHAPVYHHAAPLLHAPVLHHAAPLLHAPVLHHSASLVHAPVVHSTTTLLHKKA